MSLSIGLEEDTRTQNTIAETGTESKCRECNLVNFNAYFGITMGLTGGITVAISDVFALYCIKAGYSFPIVLIKSIVVVLVTTPIMIYNDINIASIGKKDVVLNCLKGVADTIADILAYYAMHIIGIGDSLAIYFATVIIVVSLFTSILMREKIKLHGVLSILLNITGIVLITRPEFLFGDVSSRADSKPMIGYVYCITSSLCTACGIICVRAMKSNLPLTVPPFFNGIFGAVFSLPVVYLTCSDAMCIFSVLIHNPILLAYLFGMNVTYFISMYCINRALQIEKASTITVVRNISVIVSFVSGVVVFHDSVVVLEIVGTGLIILSTVIIAVAVQRESHTKVDVQPLKPILRNNINVYS
uniref:Solute carrier family 35 member G1-like n=1 Tax=Saccoglossus kowalevskii TaxID=10224 RepID=A0ABM0MZL6_SACKO|nr:PREDICTED: solute carrier family 35 member G1-like [Saccoglossus kowalevskii]